MNGGIGTIQSLKWQWQPYNHSTVYGLPSQVLSSQPALQDGFFYRFGAAKQSMAQYEAQARTFVNKHIDKMTVLGHEWGLAEYDLARRGTDKAIQRFKKAKIAALNYNKNPQFYQEAKQLYNSSHYNKLSDSALRANLQILYYAFEWDNISPELQQLIYTKEGRLNKLYNQHYTIVDGKSLQESQVRHIFKTSRDPKEVQKVWEAQNSVSNYSGRNKMTIAERLVELVKLRNQLARKAGYDNFYDLSLSFQDLSNHKLDLLLRRVRQITDTPYQHLMKQMDEIIVKRFGIPKSQARLPWFQDQSLWLAQLTDFDPDQHLKGYNPIEVIEQTARMMGSSVQSILDKSDLFEKPYSKYKSAYAACFFINSPHDLRVIMNFDKNLDTMMASNFRTAFHEILGHLMDGLGADEKLPSLIRDLESCVTEGHAFMMENNIMDDKRWLKERLGFSETQALALSSKFKRYKMIGQVYSLRDYLWTIEFERAMYRLKDEDLTIDNLNTLWWKMGKRNMLWKKPPGRNQPDWMVVPQYIDMPFNYHNYLLGTLWQFQVYEHISQHFKKEGGLLTPEAGNYLNEHRAKGVTVSWTNLIKEMTGKPLGTEALEHALRKVFRLRKQA